MTTYELDFYLTARDTWLQTFQVMAAIVEGKLSPPDWPRNITVTTEPGVPGITMSFPEGESDLEAWANSTMIATFATLAMAADAALEDRFVNEPPRLDDSDPDRRALRCIWYMIRCAFAHPSAGVPTWESRGDYQSLLSLPGSFSIDGTLLHGAPFAIDHLGGWRLVPSFLEYTNRALNVPTPST